jgi:hypothetical protein
VNDSSIYGLLAEFPDPDSLLEAAKEVKRRGYKQMEAYTPYPIEDLDEVIGGFNPIPLIVLLGGFTGAATAWAMQYYIAAIDYPINVGGRPLNSWPSFIVIMFELTVLFAAGSAFFGTLLFCGFPRPHFPLFNVPRFAAASRDSFFLCIEAEDAIFETDRTAELLESLNPLEVWEVENA